MTTSGYGLPSGAAGDAEERARISGGYAAVSSLLWRERELLETLLYKLSVERVLLEMSVTRWLAAASRETDRARIAVQHVSVLRAAEADELAASVGLPAGTTLAGLAAAAPQPWQTILADHRAILGQLLADAATHTAVPSLADTSPVGLAEAIIGADHIDRPVPESHRQRGITDFID